MVEERGSQRRDRRLEGKSRRVLLVCGAVLSSTRALARMLPHPSISSQHWQRLGMQPCLHPRQRRRPRRPLTH
jgi:hypothetical protein